MKLDAIARLQRDARRVSEIIAVLVRYGLADWLKGLHYSWIQERLRSADGQAIHDLKPEVRVRMALSELGATFIKLGQMLSTRPDLVGAAAAEELAKLQTAAPADPFEQIAAIIEAELGRPPQALFARFDTVPLASASIAQVHTAQLPSGEEVVVKVQHAGIAENIRSDLEILWALAELAEKHSAPLRLLRPAATYRQFRRMLLRELDFTRERQHLEEFARHFAEDETVHFPAAFRAFSSRRVLTMERLDGVSVSDAEGLDRCGADLNEFARRGAAMYLEMIFRDSFYHADPHPGNLLLLPGAVLGVIDCGMVGRMDEDLRQNVEELLLAASEHDAGQLTEVVLRLADAPAQCPRQQLRGDLHDFLADYVGRPIEDLDVSEALVNLVEIIRRYHIALPPELALLLRTLILLEGTSRRLDREFSLAEVIRPYYFKMVQRRFAPGKLLVRLRHAARDWDQFLDALPRNLGDVLERFRRGNFDIHLDHRHLDSTINRLVMGLLTASLFLGSSFLWSLKAPPVIGGVSVVGAAGYILAIWWGWRLFRAVRRSGDIDSSNDPH